MSRVIVIGTGISANVRALMLAKLSLICIVQEQTKIDSEVGAPVIIRCFDHHDIDASSFIKKKHCDGRGSWPDTRKRHNSRKK